jgi:hypothetical protein
VGLRLSRVQRELISRGTILVIAAMIAWLATGVLRFMFGLEKSLLESGVDDKLIFARCLIVVAIFLYLVAAGLAALCFLPMDPRRTDVGKTMTWANRAEDFLGWVTRFVMER